MEKSKIGVYGLGVMGQSLALNMLNHGYQVPVYNKEPEIVRKFMTERITTQKVIPCEDLQSFVNSLEKPRCVFLMVTAGKVVDWVIDELKNLLESGDMIIDGGNSFYKDTIRRCHSLQEIGLHFIGVGVSGGEMGALNGPSMMPSGDYNAYQRVAPIFMDIAAKAEDGQPCCAYIGTDGAGHYVKMVHNGIEYADIQIICEAYDLMRNGAGFSIEKIRTVFEQWNQGRLKSYLIEITADILKHKDQQTGEYLIDVILDKAGQKGTGKWTSMEGLDIGAAIPTIAESVFARCISAMKQQRTAASQRFAYQSTLRIEDEKQFINDLEAAVYAAKICCYAQGFDLLKQAGEEYGWSLNFGEIAMIWRAGCIIRADFLTEIKKAYDEENIENLMMSHRFSEELANAQHAWRKIGAAILSAGVYAPAMLSTIAYFDGYRCLRTSANLIQAQRDYFGAHTYERIDEPGSFHTHWEDTLLNG